MSWLRELWWRLRALIPGRAMDRRLAEELQFHLDELTRANGVDDATEARRLAHIQFGGLDQVKEATRDEWDAGRLGDTLRDVRFGARALRRSAAFSATALVTLALGNGSATLVFAVIQSVLLKPLPYADPHELISIWNAPADRARPSEFPLSATQYFTYRDGNRALAHLGLWSTGTANVTGGAQPVEARALRVTAGTFDALGVSPALGRWPTPQDDTPGAEPTVVLSHRYWRQHFGDVSPLGRVVNVDSRPRTIIGVMPASFRFLDHDPDIALPLQLNRAELVLGSFNYFAIARMRPGLTSSDVASDLHRLSGVWLESWPAPPGFDRDAMDQAPTVRSLRTEVIGNAGGALWALLGAAVLVLVIAYANVANLVLLRSAGRRTELAIRAALGAGSFRIATVLFAEGALLGLTGGAVGLGLAALGLQLLVVAGPGDLPRIGEIGIDRVTLLTAFGLSVTGGILFGLLPVARALREPLAAVVSGSQRGGTSDPSQQRVRHALIVVQVSLAFVLLIGSGLMMRTFIALMSVDPGFRDAGSVQMFRIMISRPLEPDPERALHLQRDISARVASVPGVTAASFGSAGPLEPFISANTVLVENQPTERPATRRFKFVAPGYFGTIGTRLVAGREFSWTDIDERRPVSMVSAALAREIWGDARLALGRRIRESPAGAWREVVGVVADVFDDGVHASPPPTAYWPVLMENFEGDAVRIRRSVTMVLRTERAGTEELLKEVQRAVWSVDRNLPLAHVQTLKSIYDRSLARTSFLLLVLGTASALALILGLVGIYGISAYGVQTRRREIGIRIALGAQPGELVGRFVRHGLLLAALGAVLGIGVASVGTQVLATVLFAVEPFDPLTYAGVALLLLAAACVASYVPARKAVANNLLRSIRGD